MNTKLAWFFALSFFIVGCGSFESTELSLAEFCTSGTTYDGENVTISEGTISLLPNGFKASNGRKRFTLTDGEHVATISVFNQLEGESEPNRVDLPQQYSQDDLKITANDGSELIFGDSARVTGEAFMESADEDSSRCYIAIHSSDEFTDKHIIEPLPRHNDAEERIAAEGNPDGWNQPGTNLLRERPDIDLSDFDTPQSAEKSPGVEE